MKLRNKKTGGIVEVSHIGLVWNSYGMPADIGQYDSIAELNEEWEDAEEITLADLVKRRKAEAKHNLSGVELEKCYKALDAWVRNNTLYRSDDA